MVSWTDPVVLFNDYRAFPDYRVTWHHPDRHYSRSD
jgi:hypothetical protein